MCQRKRFSFLRTVHQGIRVHKDTGRLDIVLEKIAKSNGYASVDQMLMDYGFIPTVLTPKHKKIEIVKAIMKSLINK